MKHYHKNPRQITKKQYADLQDSLKRLGDLSGIVHDLSTDEVIGGNQRMDVFDLRTAQIELTEKLDQPDEQGTVARGFVLWQGKKYSYRAVMWDDKTREEANIRANKAGGSWDMDILANEWDIPDLLEWGFAPYEIGIAATGEPIDPNSEWKGMPEFESEDLMGSTKQVIVHLKTQEDIDAFSELVGQVITPKTKSIWYPKQEEDKVKRSGISYSDEP